MILITFLAYHFNHINWLDQWIYVRHVNGWRQWSKQSIPLASNWNIISVWCHKSCDVLQTSSSHGWRDKNLYRVILVGKNCHTPQPHMIGMASNASLKWQHTIYSIIICMAKWSSSMVCYNATMMRAKAIRWRQSCTLFTIFLFVYWIYTVETQRIANATITGKIFR